MICFICENEYDNDLEACPYCGFNPEEDEEPYCPYSIDGVCSLTEVMCYKTTDFENCIINMEDKIEDGDIEDEQSEDT